MIGHKPLTLILEFRSNRELVRRFDDSSFPRSSAWAQTKSLIEDEKFLDELSDAFGKIYYRPGREIRKMLVSVFRDGEATFTKPVPLQSYWYDVFKTLREKRIDQYEQYVVGVKACRSHYLYTLRGRREGANKTTLLSSPFFERSQPPDFADRPQDKLRGLADTILLLAPQIQQFRGRLLDLLSWFDVNLICSREPCFSDTKLTLNITPELGQPSKCVTLKEGNPILVVSQNFRDAIEALADVWYNSSVRTVLLCASSGSGKEALVEMLAVGMNITSNSKVVLSAPELSTFKRLQDAMIVSKRLRLTKNSEPGTTKQRSLLFLDEISHKPAEPIRSGLLRLLQAKMLKVGKDKYNCDHIVYVLAGSDPPDIMREKKPLDLWNRMDHTVVLHHPFFVHDEVHQREVLREYFEFFWNRHAESIKGFEGREEDLKHIVEALSQQLEAKLVSPFLPLMSVRTLEKMVTRLIAKTKRHFKTTPKSFDEDYHTDLKKIVDNWLEELRDEMVPQLNSQKLLREQGVF